MNPYFDCQQLEKGVGQVTQLIQRMVKAQNTGSGIVHPTVKIGFLRKALDKSAPQEGVTLDKILGEVENEIYPGTTLWQSPRFFGYFPSSIAITTIYSEMLATAMHSPAFNYAVSPSHTELENIAVDWAADLMGLPQVFRLNNAGGGILKNSISESCIVAIHAAKIKKMTELSIEGNDPRVLKLVGYFSEISHINFKKGLKLKDIYYKREIPSYYDSELKNYQIDLKAFEQTIAEDVEAGLIPFWFGAVSGGTFSCGIDFTSETIAICKKYGMWIHLDAAYLGSSWLLPELRHKP